MENQNCELKMAMATNRDFRLVIKKARLLGGIVRPMPRNEKWIMVGSRMIGVILANGAKLIPC